MTQAWNDEIWHHVGGAHHQTKRQLTALTRGLAEVQANKILDLGCGPGRDFAFLSANGATIVGADQSAVALEHAAALDIAEQLVRVSDDCRLPLEDNHFDLVWCAGVLEHVLDTQTMLSEVRRVLEPRGKLIVVTPDHPLQTRLRLALRGWEDHFDPMSPHLRFFTRRSLGDLITNMGFAVERIDTEAGQLIAFAQRP